MAQQFCNNHTPVRSQYGQNLCDVSLLYTNADKARLQHRSLWLNHNPSSNLLVHDLHCTSNLSSNLVRDLHCTSCAVSPTSSSLRFSKLCFFLSTSATSPRSTFLCVRNNRLCASAFWAAMLRRLSLALGKIHAHFHYLSGLTHLHLTVHAKTREHSQG